MLPNSEEIARAYKSHRRRQKGFMILAAVVVFCTVYALVLPAITLEQICPVEEHTHTRECYTQITSVSVTKLQCTAQAHSHSADCGSSCGYADYLIHTHDSSCYDAQGQLCCPLPQIREHIHGEECYSVPEGHTHTEDCFARQQGELICGLAQEEGHTHGEECRDEEGDLICQLEECQGHTHDDSCYSWTEERICPLQEQPAGEPVLICQQPQIQAHRHDNTCAEGHNCQMTEVLVHTHGPECFVTVEEPVDTETLTCDNTDPEHIHTDLCYGTWELTCGMEEHTHSDSCFQSEAPEDGQTSENGEDAPEQETLTSVATLETPETENTPVVPDDETDGEPEEETAEPLAMENYITGATLSYSTDGSTWTQINENTEGTVPGNATFLLKVNFSKVDSKGLQKAGYQMTYQLPELLKNAQAVGNLTVGTETKGHITVENGVATLTFDKTWVGTLSEINGDFEVSGRADLSVAEQPEGNKIYVGDTTITIPFESNLIAKYGDVELTKTLVKLEEGEDGRFLCYTLTVTAGADGCPDVTVEDQITSGIDCIQKKEDGTLDIRLEPETGSVNLTENGLNWTVGELGANESRTLTYKIPLTKDYLGAKANTTSVANTATVSSGEYVRDTDTAIFTPKGKVTMSKRFAAFEKNENDDGGTIRYTVWVHADEGNNYTFDNLVLWDALDGTVDGGSKTDAALLPYLSYGSFTLYQGGNQNQNGADKLTPIDNAGEAQIADNGKSFQFPVGDLEPGESKTLVYYVKVDQGIFTTGNMKLKIGNRVTVMTDPNRESGGRDRLENYSRDYEMDGKTWVWKQKGEEIKEETTITMSDDQTFTVPAGSYRYEVGVNETGDWDVSGAELVDKLVGQYMAYVGYVKVEAYQKVNGKKADMPSQTVWIDIDGETTFSFVPKDIGLPEENYAYRLTYYARPQNLENVSEVEVVNEFYLKGEVIGAGGTKYTLGSVWVSATVRVEGQNFFHAAKRFWYYDPNEEGNGAMYWIIEAQGNRIPQGTKFRDSIDQTMTGHTISGVVRAFVGKLDDLPEDWNLSTLPEGTRFTGYTAVNQQKSMILTLTEDVTLTNGESLYFVVKTVPDSLPTEKGNHQTFGNQLETQDPGENALWTSQSGDQHTIVSGGDIYKTLAAVFQAKTGSDNQITDETVNFTTGDEKTVLQYDHLTQSGAGVYAAWKVTINRDSTLSGSYRIREQIPAGMELVYVQRYSTGQKYSSLPTFGQIEDLSDHTKVMKTFVKTYDQNPTPAYLYIKGQEVTWQVDGLVADYKHPGDYYVTYLVVCKVTDADVLQGGQEKTFDNQVTLLTQAGQTVDGDVNSVTLGAPRLSKTGTYDKAKGGSSYPFEIRVNELGTDLVPGADTIVLEDTMCDILTLNVDTIQVINTATGATVTNWKAQVDGQTLRLTLPDDQPLTITYTATIHAKPGEAINISNNAHWYGYTSTPESSVKEENFHYAAGGSLSGSECHTSVQIQKRDRDDTQKLLKGATFALAEVDEDLNPKMEFTTKTGTTDENGKLQFEELKFNTIYCLTETKAPDGYVLDGTPHYFMVCRKVEDQYPDVPKGVTAVYDTPTYAYTAYNGRGEVQVDKKFCNAAGEPLNGAISGTYRFAIYETKLDGSTTPKPLQTITHTYFPDGSAQTEKFTGLEVGKTYYVYELDDSGAPILPGNEGVASAMPFVVTYTENAVTVAAQTATVTVTNRMNYQQLPSTGGDGIFGIWLLGVALILGAWFVLDRRKRMEL